MYRFVLPFRIQGIVPLIWIFGAVPFLAFGAESDATSNWPVFQNSGAGNVAEGLPTEWSPAKNIAWKADIDGYGQSTPIVVGQQIVVTSTSGPNKEKYHLAAFALRTGEKLWQRDFDNPTPIENTSYTSRAAPTPVADDAGYIAFFEGGIVVAVTMDGSIRWQRNLVSEYGSLEARHGLSSSLEQDDDHVFVWVERSQDPYVLALSKESGEEVWKVPGAGSTSWASPRIVPTDDGPHLVCSGTGKIVGYDPSTGSRLWEFSDLAGNTSNTPVPVAAGKFLIGASGGDSERNAGAAAESNGLIEIKRQPEGGFTAEFVWQADKASTTFGSPIVAGGTACLVNRAGVLFRLDLETGKQESAVRTAAGGIWATPIVAGDHLYVFGYKGTTSVISLASGREIAENRLWDAPAQAPQAARGGPPAASGPVLYAVAPAPPYLIIRRGDMLYAVKEVQ